MIPFLKALLFDRGAFLSFARGFLALVGIGMATVQWDKVGIEAPWWVPPLGAGIAAVGMALRSNIVKLDKD